MHWRGRELTEESFLSTTDGDGYECIIRAGDVVMEFGLQHTTHFQYIQHNPDTIFYSWPTERELIEHFGA